LPLSTSSSIHTMSSNHIISIVSIVPIPHIISILVSTYIQYAYTSDQHQAGPSTRNPTQSMKLRPVDPTFHGETTRLYALCLGGRRVWYALHPPWSLSLHYSTSPSLSFPCQPLHHFLHPSPFAAPQSLNFYPPPFPTSILTPPPPPTKTKRYAPLHLIDLTTFTEGKTMREAAGGRSAWI